MNVSYNPPESRNQSLTRKIGWSAIASAFGSFGRLMAHVAVARMLGPDGVGQLAYILWLIEVVNVLCSFGLPNCLTRYVAELNGRCEAIQASVFARWLFLRYLILALVGSIVVGVLFGHSSQHTNQRPLLPVLMLYSIVRSLQVLNQADLAGKQRFDLLARINVAATVSLILGVVIGTRFFGVLGSVCGYTAGASLSAAYTVVMFRRPTANHGVSVELRRRATRFSYDTWLAMVVSVFIW
jgi:O-antigen/teichoic acid export membrane protein